MSTHSAVILAAGKGTRFRSELPKVLHTVCGRTLLERTLLAAAPLKLDEIVVVIGYMHELVADELEKIVSKHSISCSIKTVIQHEQLGTGHAVSQALKEVAESSSRTLIVPGDVPLITSELLDRFQAADETGGGVLTCLTCKLEDPSGYGRVVKDQNGRLTKIVEHRDCSQEELKIKEINSSIYLVDTQFLRKSISLLSNENSQSEFYLTDIVKMASDSGKNCLTLVADEPWLVEGANTRAELNTLERRRRREINHQLMLNGVTLENPDDTYIDEDVTVEEDCFIGSGTRLNGESTVGRGSVVLGSSFVKNTSIGRGVVIKPFCFIDSAEIGDDCQIGPFAHLRPGSKLGTAVKIGNFVETKKSILQEGVKVNHLSYIGDAEICTNTNIGAGTITCNYDGENKHKTTIRAGAFIGSNTSLVAPVTVGENAVIGAGSTITDDVPDGALGIARQKQKNISDWKARKRK